IKNELIVRFLYKIKLSYFYKYYIIVIMVDNYGISANHNKAMIMYLDKDEITPYDHVQLQQVPFFLHIPGHEEGEVISKVAGQIDVKPTLLRSEERRVGKECRARRSAAH